MSSFNNAKVKSLRDCLLKSTVVNFDVIFLEYDRKKRKAVVKKGICLPPYLFEGIQDKSLEICWIIPHKSLKTCLSRREALNWVNINLTTGPLKTKHLLNIAESNFPLKQLSFQTTHVTDGMLDAIEAFSSTIEVLEIGVDAKNYCILNWKPTEKIIKFQKLKVLSLDSLPSELLHRFDLSLCSDSLRQLNIQLQKYDDSMKFFSYIKILRNLESFTLFGYRYSELLNDMKHLENLRNFVSDCYLFKKQKLRFVEILPKLENLTLARKNLLYELKSSKGRTLKYVGMMSRKALPEKIKKSTTKFGSMEDFQSFINYLDYSRSFDVIGREYSFDDFRCLSDLIEKSNSSPTVTQLNVIEKTILMILKGGRYQPKHLDKFKQTERLWTQDFVIRLSNYLVSLSLCEVIKKRHKRLFSKLIMLESLQKYMTRYVAMNPNSSASILYSEIGIQSR